MVEKGTKSVSLRAALASQILMIAVLNGYGFCIQDNPCDVVAIRFGQLPPPVVQELEEILGEWDPSQIHYVRGRDFYGGLYPVQLEDFPKITESGIPPALWTVLEVIKRHQHSQRASWRNTLSARCDLLEVLATKYDNIDQHVVSLPPTPANDKQRYAKMYRDGQMKILKENVDLLEGALLEKKWVTLDEALATLRKDNRAAFLRWERMAKAVFDTQSLDKIREQDMEAQAWMMWFCESWVFLCKYDPLLSRVFADLTQRTTPMAPNGRGHDIGSTICTNRIPCVIF